MNPKQILSLTVLVTATQLIGAITPTLELSLIEPNSKSHFYGSEAIFGREFPSYSTDLKKYEVVSFLGDDAYGCSIPDDISVPPNYALLVSRGKCEFLTKAKVAQSANASALIIYESLENMYTSPYDGNQDFALKDPCNLDCASGIGYISQEDAKDYNKAIQGYPTLCGSGCPSQLCALTGESHFEDTSKRKICCVPNDYLIVGATWDEIFESKITIPTAWVAVSDGKALRSKLNETEGGFARSKDLKISVSYREIPRVDIPSLILWHLAIFTVIYASYRAAQDMRLPLKIALYKYYGYPTQSLQAEHEYTLTQTDRLVVQEVQQVNYRHAVGFVFFASAVLILLFLLIRTKINVVYIMMVPFAISAVVALANVLALPYLLKVFPSWRKKSLVRLPYVGTIKLANVVVYSLCTLVVLIWFVTRHSRGFFFIHNALGILVCTLFLIQIKFTSLKTCALVMLMFFVYDVVMVFFTPLVTGGRSVMVDVATAGNLSPPDTNLSWDCYCRQNPNDSRSCGPGEIMPMLFFFPRLNDWRGGQAMLGFGDIIIPGILLTYVLRWEYLYLLGVTGAQPLRPNVDRSLDTDTQQDTEEPLNNIADVRETYENTDNNPSVAEIDDSALVEISEPGEDITNVRNEEYMGTERETDHFLPTSSSSHYDTSFAYRSNFSFSNPKKYPLPSGWSIGLPFLHLSHEQSRIGEVFHSVRGSSTPTNPQQHASLLQEPETTSIDSTVLPIGEQDSTEVPNDISPPLDSASHIGLSNTMDTTGVSLDTTRTPISLWLYGVLGYTVGLVLAMLAVSITGMGQPALLYIVPCTLLAVQYRAKQVGVWYDIWFGIYNLDDDDDEP